MAGTGGSEAAVALDELRSWWEVPAIAHFCSLFRTAFRLPDFEIEVRPRGPAPRRNSQNFPRAPPSLPSPPPSPGAGAGGAALFRRAPGRTKLWGGPRARPQMLEAGGGHGSGPPPQPQPPRGPPGARGPCPLLGPGSPPGCALCRGLGHLARPPPRGTGAFWGAFGRFSSPTFLRVRVFVRFGLGAAWG